MTKGTPPNLKEAIKRAFMGDVGEQKIMNAVRDRLAHDFGIAMLNAPSPETAMHLKMLFEKIFPKGESS